MKASALKYAILSSAASLAIAMLWLLPFHALLTVWISQATGHYTAVRLWKEVLLLAITLCVMYLMLTDAKIRTHTLTRRLILLIIAYTCWQLAMGFVAHQAHHVTLKALAYGLLIDMRFLVFFLVCWALALRTGRLQANWQRLLLWPAAGVIIFGILQIFVLPSNVLTHFGYGPGTINPVETVNNNAQYLRATSTLRGANPLGAYLLLPLSALAVLFIRGLRTWQVTLGFIAGSIVLGFTFSRSAWLGLLVSIAIVVVLSARSAAAKRRLGYAAAAALVLLLAGALSVHGSARLENVFLHTETHSKVATSSNQGHVAGLKQGVHDIVHEPLGRGPGTAGPASLYNNGRGRIAENYYIQVGQELGILGLLVFVTINAGVAYLLWMRRRDTLALALLASFIGLGIVNMLSHAWSDDTLAYVWWGLAGIAMVNAPIGAHEPPVVHAKKPSKKKAQRATAQA